MSCFQRRQPRGFTLIELMTVTAIVGILASVALPEYQRLVLRTKLPERTMLMTRIKQGAQDVYLRNQFPASGNLTGLATPTAVPGTRKLMPNWNQADWNVLFASMTDIEGSVYYQYSFLDQEPAGLLTIMATGDLDGDGISAIKVCTYQRVSGSYQIDPIGLPGTGCICRPGGAVTGECEPEWDGLF